VSGKHHVRAGVLGHVHRAAVEAFQDPRRRLVAGVVAALALIGLCAGALLHRDPLGPPRLVLPAPSAADAPAASPPLPSTAVLEAQTSTSSPEPRPVAAEVPGRPHPEVTTPGTRRPATPATGATAAPASGVTARYVVSSSWDTGFVVGVTVTNTGTAPQHWHVDVAHAAASGVRVVTNWNADVRRDGAVARFSGGPLAPGQSSTFGFEAVKSVAGAVRPVGCAVNGATTCDVAP
jgi:hypothetical protein